MIQVQPQVDPSARLELREVAALFRVSKSSVLRWTSSGLLRCGGLRRSNRRKYWTGAELIRFWKSQM